MLKDPFFGWNNFRHTVLTICTKMRWIMWRIRPKILFFIILTSVCVISVAFYSHSSGANNRVSIKKNSNAPLSLKNDPKTNKQSRIFAKAEDKILRGSGRNNDDVDFEDHVVFVDENGNKLSEYSLKDPKNDGEENDEKEEKNQPEDAEKFSEFPCIINGDRRVKCVKDASDDEVYFPFNSFLAKYFDVILIIKIFFRFEKF